MKIRKLELRAFGPFTNRTITFDTAPAAPGLHIVVGANEAGKSTVLRALQAALFGIGNTDLRDSHFHPKDALCVGLEVETTEGEILHAKRFRKKKETSFISLTSGKTLSPQEWEQALPVADPERFEQMFALSYERLVKGGQLLSEFKSDIGQAMLAAAGDLGQTAVLALKMQASAEAIYNPRATSSKLRQALSAYSAADKTMRSERYTSRDYKLAYDRREELVVDLKKISGERNEQLEEQRRLQRIDTSASHVRRLLEDEKILAGLGVSPALVGDFESRYTEALGRLSAANTSCEDSRILINDLTQKRAALLLDPVIASLEAEIDRQKEQVSAVRKARLDIPIRQTEWNQLAVTRARLCSDLGLTAETVNHPLLGQRTQIEKLADDHIRLTAFTTDLPRKIAELTSKVARTELLLTEFEADADTKELAECLLQAKSKRELEVETTKSSREMKDSVEQLNQDLSAFPLWRGTFDELESLRVPLSASVIDCAERLVLLRLGADYIADESREISSGIDSLLVEEKRLDRQDTIPTEQDLLALRLRRNQGWLVVKDVWLNMEWSPFLRQVVKTQNPLNGELSHGVVTQVIHEGV